MTVTPIIVGDWRKLGIMWPLVLAACGGPETEEVGHRHQALAEAGPWHIPAETLAIGDLQNVNYTGAGSWVGESGCYGDITPGTALLREYLYGYYPQTYQIGGYACRPINGNASQMSVHATGRALDIMLPLDSGQADNDLGDPIGNWLIENSEAIGIQLIIWDRYSWGPHRQVGNKGRDYGGAHPHHDHLHVELSLEMSDQQELWFLDDVQPPVIEGCEPIPRGGGVIEETDACFRAFGPGQYWRTEEAGSGGSLLWTNAFENDTPSNWARWNAYVEASGLYRIEVFIDPDWGVNRDTTYRIAHAEGEDVRHVDQSIEQGWVTLGDYPLSKDLPAWIDVYDNVEGPVPDDQRIAVDAVRLSSLEGGDFLRDGAGSSRRMGVNRAPGDDPDIVFGGDAEASCAMGVTARGAPRPHAAIWLALAAIGLLTRRRRRAAAVRV